MSTDRHSEHFPILRSVLSAEALAETIAGAYGLEPVRCRLIKAVILDTYHLTATGDNYILRLYPAKRRDLSEIKAELELLLYLKAQGASVSVPLPRSNGKYLLAISAPEGTRYAALFTYAHGTPLSQSLGADAAYVFGRALADVHAIADTYPHSLSRPTIDFNWLVEWSLKGLAPLWGQSHTNWVYLRQVADTLRPQFATLSTEQPRYGLCHGDAGANNAHVTPDGQLTLFDFDFCGYGWRAYDIGTFLIGESEEVTQAFLAGYQAVRPLDRSELDSIPLFQIAQNIWVLGMRASYLNEWGTVHFSSRFVDHVLDFIKQMMQQLEPSP